MKHTSIFSSSGIISTENNKPPIISVISHLNSHLLVYSFLLLSVLPIIWESHLTLGLLPLIPFLWHVETNIFSAPLHLGIHLLPSHHIVWPNFTFIIMLHKNATSTACILLLNSVCVHVSGQYINTNIKYILYIHTYTIYIAMEHTHIPRTLRTQYNFLLHSILLLNSTSITSVLLICP
jgi:hypothetical protein